MSLYGAPRGDRGRSPVEYRARVTAAGTSSPPPARHGRTRFAWIARAVGLLVAVLAVAFCAKTLVGSWSEVRSALDHARIGGLAVGLVASGAAMVGLALLWWRCLHLFGSPVGAGAATAWYFGGELGKYVPGGVWTVLGRGELARRGGQVSRSSGYATTLISYGVMTVAAAVVCGALGPAATVSRWGWALLALVPLGAVAVHPVVLGRVLALLGRLTRGRLDLEVASWPAMLRLVAFALPTWALVGAAAISVTESFGLHEHPVRVAFAAVAAWIIGFLAVAVPAGAGVREVVFVVLCGLPAAPATTVAVVMRVLLIVVDAVGGLAGLGYLARSRGVAR